MQNRTERDTFLKYRGYHYNNIRRLRLFLGMVLLLILPLIPVAGSTEEGIAGFLLQLQNDLSSRRFDSYLDAYVPELRDEQKNELSRHFDLLKMDSVQMTWVNRRNFDPEKPNIFLQVVYQNDSTALVEIWQILLENDTGRWRVKEKSLRGNISQLYKVRLPAEHIEEANRVEISQADINLIFHDALVFYDNIPDLETALLVIGDGHLTFSPSNANERHQLEVLYKKKVFEDRVDYAFLHFSTAFFEQNVKIDGRARVPASAVDKDKLDRAASIFKKYRARHFSIETPFSPEPLSFLPQGEDAAIYFEAKKRGEFFYVYSSFAEEEISLYEVDKNRYISLYSPVVDDGRSRLVISFSQKFDIRHYDIELDFEPRSLQLSAKARIHLLSQVGRLDAVKFKMNPELEIVRIYDEKRRELFFTQDPSGRIFYVYFLEPVSSDTETVIEVLYRGRLEPPTQVTDTVAALQAREIHPMPFRYDTYLFSQSAQWYPASLAEDYFTARLKTIVPPEYSSIANGQLVEQGILNGIQKVTEIDKIGNSFSVFESKLPLKYLSLLVGRLSLIQEKTGALSLAAYAESQVGSPKKEFLDEAGRILEFYESRFGPFPFENLRIVQRLWMTAGGHSPASFIILNELPRFSRIEGGIRARLIGNPDSPVDLSPKWREYFIAHEIAHQWWGQGVTPARYRDQWLSEGLAQFAAVLYLQSKHGEDAAAGILEKFSKWTEKKSEWGPITLGSRLSFIDFEAYQAVIYDKTTLVLNMLRDLLGEEVFFSALKTFFAEHKYKAASTGQFCRTMEKVSGRDLSDFFRLWFDSHVLPETKVNTSVVKREGGAFLKVRVNQLLDAFVFPLWISWEDESGTLCREKLVIDRKSQEFEFPVAGSASKIEVNPERAVPGKFRIS